MKKRAQGAWVTLNASYYCAPVCHPGKFLDDASLLLEGARGITQSLADLLSQDVDINPDDLAKALWAVSLLMEMGQSSAEVAHGRIRRMRKEIREVEDGK
ncbi:hypothetical protein [Dyella mobilis]|uniref:Cell division protein ZapA n=1 Tax=Dyella mobilis TaxID=1849582 RepID=A0ABS2KCC1_9GAMM|nr:hypothetical protein [Dyella mobilis]MBM7128835.1 hypothetical protein [Dyella mobilis]GLQ99166.1 hypothetical protein GCM10007863_35860 [Dyella mobilis]